MLRSYNVGSVFLTWAIQKNVKKKQEDNKKTQCLSVIISIPTAEDDVEETVGVCGF